MTPRKGADMGERVETPEQAEKRQKRERKTLEAAKEAKAYADEGVALRANMHRLRTLRLAKESAEAREPPAATVKARLRKARSIPVGKLNSSNDT